MTYFEKLSSVLNVMIIILKGLGFHFYTTSNILMQFNLLILTLIFSTKKKVLEISKLVTLKNKVFYSNCDNVINKYLIL